MSTYMVTLPQDVIVAMGIVGCHKDVPDDLIAEAEANGLTADMLTGCRATGAKMVLTDDKPYWLITCKGNAVIAESRLQDAGFDEAFAGRPDAIWLRIATDEERARYERETEEG
ncbi:MAG: hypothetical protein WBL79_00025 [Bacillota bacterium]